MNNEKYKAVVIGCGKIGIEKGNYAKEVQPATHAGAYETHPRIKLSGFVDIDKERLKVASRYFPNVPLFDSAGKMLKSIKPDIVSIATYPDSHLELIRTVAKHKPKVIVCEKPIAATLGEAEEIIKLCRNSNTLLFINHTRRFDPLFQKFRQEIKQGLIGEVVQVSYYYYNGLFNNGTHLVDLLRFFLGEIDWLMAVTHEKTSIPLSEDKNVDAILHFKQGALASIQSLPPNYGFSEIYFYGTKGRLAFKDLCYQAEYRKLIENEYYKGYYQLDSTTKTIGKPRSLMISMANHVVDCLDNKKQPISTGEDGLFALKILFALRKSSQNNGKLINL